MRFPSAGAAVALFASLSVAASAETADFGSPPSGRVPILFNDRHVYAKPDELRRGRLLAALVRGKTFLVPLRSMFEQAGATVAYDRESRSTIVRARGVTVEVTVGVPEVRINGETRPLDVPPEAYGDDVLVPVRVLVESLGAYVEYEPSLHSVVIRYVVAQSVPTPAATPVVLQPAPPAPLAQRPVVPPGPPIPKDTPQPETFVAGDVAIAPTVANAFSPKENGGTGRSFDVRGATEFSLFDVPLDVDGEYAAYAYDHPAGPVSVLGGSGSTFVPGFGARDSEIDVHLGAQINPQKIYVAIGYVSLGNDYGYPRVGGLGAGFEKLPVLSRAFSYDASVFYYPNVSGGCAAGQCPAGATLSYGLLTYSAGLTYAFGPVFVEAGYRGDEGTKKASAPIGFSHDGPFAGLGLHF